MGHINARLTVHGKVLLIERVTVDNRPVAHVAKELGISRQCAHHAWGPALPVLVLSCLDDTR